LFDNGRSVETPGSEPARSYRVNQPPLVKKASEQKANFLVLVIFGDLRLVLFFVGPPLVILLYSCEVAARELAEIEIALRVVLVLQSVLRKCLAEFV
jgi:hypothetical protein